MSHQVNHVAAGIWSAKNLLSHEFLAVHVSGGTTEIIKVSRNRSDYKVELLGGTDDLAAGQFIDRIGVLLGLSFPAGPQLEKIAAKGQGAGIKIPVAVSGSKISFSGPESHVRRILAAKSAVPAEIASGVEWCIADSLFKAIAACIKESGIGKVLLIGSVLANKYINSYIKEKLIKDFGAEAFAPASEYSSDNAVGAAYYALKAMSKG